MEDLGLFRYQLFKEMLVISKTAIPFEILVVSVFEGLKKVIPIQLVLKIFVMVGQDVHPEQPSIITSTTNKSSAIII
jgi:hypothetical protein